MAGQLVAVLLLFALFVVLPLPDSFFSSYGLIVGPVSWLICSLATGRVISLPLGRSLAAAVLSGAVAGLIGLALTHAVGLLAGIITFGLAAGAQTTYASSRSPA